MLLATFAQIDEEDVPRLRAWLDSLADRRDELEESYRCEGARHELFFLIRVQRGPILVLISEVEDLERAVSSFLRSRLPLNVEFKSLVQDISNWDVGVELLYDSAQHVEVEDC